LRRATGNTTPAADPGRWLPVVLLIVLGFGLPLNSAITVADDIAERRFEQFLARLGLVDLQIRHLEQVLTRKTDARGREKTAQHLADLYASQLIASSEDSETYQRLNRRIQQLIEQVPGSRTASLEVMLLQADYQRAESLITQWMGSPADTESRDAAAAILVRIAPQLDQRQSELRSRVEDLLDEVDLMDPGDERDAKETELSRIQSVAGRAAYFAAWSNYYLARANPRLPNAKKTYTRARDIFRQLLGLDAGYPEVEVEFLGLESIWRSRSLVGLALAEAAVGNLDESVTCFGFLESASVPPEVRDQAPYWRLESLLSANRFDEALAYAKQRVGEYSSNPTQGKISFCAHLVRTAYARPEAAPPHAADLGTLGIAGLVKLRQLRIVKELLEKYQIPLDAADGFYLQWIQGQSLLEAAEKSKTQEDCSAAAARLSAALEAPDVNQDLGAAAQCRYQLGWCLYHLNQFEEAARMYESAISGLQAVGDATAVQAAWAAFLAYRKLAKTQPRFVSSAIAVLDRIKQEFPDHEYARRADYQIGKLREGVVSAAETLRRLQKVPESSPDYLDARYDICVLLHQQWAKSDEAGKESAADRLFRSVDVYVEAAKGAGSRSRVLRCCLLAAEAALLSKDAGPNKADAYLEKAKSSAESPSVDRNLVAEYHYRRLQRATLDNNEEARRHHASWLVENAPGSAYELPALVIAAKAVDRSLKSDADHAATPQLEEALDIYGRLVALWGDTPEAISSNKNARIAISKWAHYAERLGRFDDAAQRLERLLEAFPTDKGYLRRAGLAWYQAENHERSVVPWRTLLVGLPKGSEGWYEAKYYQIQCLFRIDPDRARKTLNQFRLLYPDPPPEWREKFAQLETG